MVFVTPGQCFSFLVSGFLETDVRAGHVNRELLLPLPGGVILCSSCHKKSCVGRDAGCLCSARGLQCGTGFPGGKVLWRVRALTVPRTL